MKKSKKFLAGLLAMATVLTFVPVSNVSATEEIVTDEVQTFNNEEDKQYTCNTTFNIIVEAISYTDTNFTKQGDATSGEAVPKMYQTALQSFTYEGSGEAYFDLELDIQDILDQIDLYTGGGSYVLGTPTAVSPDDYSEYGKINNSGTEYAKITDVEGVSLSGSTLSMTNVRGLDKYNWYGLRSDSAYSGGYTSLDAVRQVVIQIPYCVTEQVIDPEFKGKFDHGYIPSVIFETAFGYSASDMYTIYFSEPATNVKEDKTQIPLMIVKGGNYPDSVETELIYLTSYYSHWNGKIIDLRTGVATSDYDIYDLTDFDKNPNPYIEREYSVDTTNYQALSAFNKWVNRTFAVNNFANGEGDSNVPYLIKVEGSDPVDGLYTKFTVKFKASYCRGLNWEYNMSTTTKDSVWSHQYGMTNSACYVVNDPTYTRVRNYYNIYDDGTSVTDVLDDATLVKTYTGDDSQVPSDEAPSTEVEGYMYLRSDTKTDTERIWDYYDSVYRYFAKLIDMDLDYNIKYKVEYENGSPAEGISLKGETTDANGYISGVDTYSLNLRNLYYKSAEDKYYLKTRDDYTRDSVTWSNMISCENNDYYFNLDWNGFGDNIEASKLVSFDGLLNINAYGSDIKVIDDDKEPFTKVVVITIDNPLVKHTINVYDKYIDEEGNDIKTDLRQTDTIEEGSGYSYDALSPKDYVVTGNSNYSGVANSDLDITFVYQKEKYYDNSNDDNSNNDNKTDDENVTVKNTIQLDKSKATIYTKGKKTIKLVATVTGESTDVKWKSSNKKVAAVDSKGKVTAKKTGTATISATANGITVKCKITVKKPTIKAAGKVSVKKGKTKQLNVKAIPEGKIQYKSSNKKIVTVTKKGVIKGKKKGKATITIKCNGVTKKVKVTVK